VLRSVARKMIRGKVGTLSHADLHAFIDELQVGLTNVHNRIAEVYFLPIEEPMQQAQSA
jgi:hypothetical protein